MINIFNEIDLYNLINYCRQNNYSIDRFVSEINSKFLYYDLDVSEKVKFSIIVLNSLNSNERQYLCKKLLEEQVLSQRNNLMTFSKLNGQSSQIDTGYIAQHLTSFVTQISGQGMRGKGDDLIDHSEIKSANFIDSMDKNGQTAPRWNFTAKSIEMMESFLNYPQVYLVSVDLNSSDKIRIRIWKIIPSQHKILKERYIEWMNKLGYPKFNSASKPDVNFQLFPPRNRTNDNFARHGNGRSNGFPKLEIPLENIDGSSIIFEAVETDNSDFKILKFND